MTLKQLDELFSNIASAHKQINDYHFGFLWTIEEKMNAKGANSCKYPLLVVVPMQGVTGTQVKDRTFQVMVMDIPNKDKSNLIEVWSDTEQILDDVIKTFRYESTAYELVDEPILYPYDEEHTDWVSGYRAELNIRTNFNSNYCDIPSTSFVSPESPAVIATIIDQNGNTVQTLTKGQTYTVIIASGISDDLTATVQVIDNI